MAKKADFAVIQLSHLISKLDDSVNTSTERVTKSFDTVASSLNMLKNMFASSKMFKKANVRLMSIFFKVVPKQLSILNQNLKNLNSNTLVGNNSVENLSGNMQDVKQDSTPEKSLSLMNDLINQVRNLNSGIEDFGVDLDELSSAKPKNGGSELSGVDSELGSIKNEMVDIIQAMSVAGTTMGGTATDVNALNMSLSEMVDQMNDLTKGTSLNADEYLEVTSRVRGINDRLTQVRRNMGKVNEGFEESSDHMEDSSNSLAEGIKSMLVLQSLDIFQQAGAKDAASNIASLSDELLDLQKAMGGVEIDLKAWRHSAVDTAVALNELGVAADPAEIADLYNIIKRTGIDGEREIKSLAKSVKLFSDAAAVSKEEAADFAKVMIKEWGMSVNSVDKVNSAFVRMQGIHGQSVSKIIDQTKDMADHYLVALDGLDAKGKETFTVGLSSAIGAFNKAGIENIDLIKDMGLALTDPQEAAKKFGMLLQGTGYDVAQMQKDLLKGDPTKAMQAILKGASNLRGKSGIELKRISDVTGIAVKDLTKLSVKSGQIQQDLLKGTIAGTEELINGQKSLTKSAQLESDKLGNLFERIGKKAKTWMAEIGVSALDDFGIELLELAPKIAPVVFIADKLGFNFGKLKGIFSGITSGIAGLIGPLFGLGAAATTAAGGEAVAATATTSLGAAVSIALGPIGLIAIAIAGVIAAGVALVKYGPRLLDMFERRFPRAGKKARDLIEPIIAGLEKFWKKIKPIVMGTYDLLKTTLSIAWEVFKKSATIALDLVMSTFKLAWTVIKPIAKGIGKLLGIMFVDEDFENKAKTSEKVIKNWGERAIEHLDKVSLFVSDLGDWFDYLGKEYNKFIVGMTEDWRLFKQWLTQPGAWLGEVYSDMVVGLNKIKDRVAEWATSIKEFFKSPFVAIRQELSDFMNSAPGRFFSKIGGFLGFGGSDEDTLAGSTGKLSYVQQDAAIGVEGTKVIEPTSNKIFTEKPEVMISTTTAPINVNQEDVVEAIHSLIGVVKKNQNDKQAIQQSIGVPATPDARKALLKNWSL